MGSGNGQHDHRTCRDSECERYACRIWHEAWNEAWREGYDTGFAEGIRSCPLPHQG